MNKFRRAILWAALAVIIALAILSIYGAFIGAERAQEFFNRVPLAVYWVSFAVLLAVAIAVFRRLVRVPGLLMMHAGCILILAGGMWGSKLGNDLQKRFLGIEKIREGRMVIYEGTSENQVLLDGGDRDFKTLPFALRLKDFRIEYYQPAHLYIETRQGDRRKVPVEVGKEFALGEGLGMAKVARTFENFKMGKEDGKNVFYDDPNVGSNPALEVQITQPDGQVATKYVFEKFPGHSHGQDAFLMNYHRTISDYISEIDVVENDKVVAAKDVEVNHPLHFGGYHFYQSSYDDKAGQYTVLSVHSDTGLYVVYAGYWLLCLGVIWHLWLRHILTKAKSKNA
ncbi:MAG TPA: cytochrome c biogenesis protein ResB [Sedimentisphaerales bacterium]|nr:cytochrome c biogenesis protein ResB [Sedimentisphaerales bacterium]